MTGNLAVVLPIGEDDGIDLGPWAEWLRGQLAEDWRPGEWNSESWLFTGDFENPNTTSWRCLTEACGAIEKVRYRRCKTCDRAFQISGMSADDFHKTFVPEVNRRYTEVDLCAVERDGKRCARERSVWGLCRSHSTRWVAASRTNKTLFTGPLEEWIRDVAQPFDGWARCLVKGCELEGWPGEGLCRIHTRRRKIHREANKTADLAGWVEHQPPYLAGHQFSLAPLGQVARLEVLFMLQQREARNQKIEPSAVRAVVQRLEGIESVLTAERERVDATGWKAANSATHLRELAWAVERGHERFLGIEPTDKLVWDMTAVGHQSFYRKAGPPGVRSTKVDFSVIKQLWLREAAMEWARSTRPNSKRFRHHVSACLIAAKALGRLPGGGMDPAALWFGDMTAVVEGFRTLTDDEGEPRTNKYRRDLLAGLFTVLDFGRSAGMLATLSGSFGRHKSHRIVVDESNEDEIGKAVPESVIRQLDAQLGLLGQGISYGSWAGPEDVVAMFQTVYQVLRDTGRRPREVLSLRRDCLEFTGNDCLLIWNNYKGKRLRRRLPITMETARIIQQWDERRGKLKLAPTRCEALLFPAISDISRDPHLGTGNFGRAMRKWVTEIPEIHSEGTGQDGNPIPFEREKIYAYAFRHSYAQRHADGGVAIDVLKELMDHRSADTTARYYKVSLKRKQEAVKTMRLHVVDRHGNPAPMASNRAYELRSVAVPFGGCTEPSNVKAGGQACPIRFQCAGCGFYRPDPSYLAAIEDQIRDLKADKETAVAMDAAEYVIRNLQDQIDSFKKVAVTMREQIEKLPADEREALMQSVKILRKTRAAVGRAMLPLTVINRKESPA
ncbi:site-specific integrase [Streptomyces sp. NBC_00988]|uniref:tyrosine-type recombinase/integrase n=1 Tax=Streptomyces sp. NBC_00988 TaxID=2903704 RepID=UPI00386C9FD9|nr:site-specific integrase [Streptomyces sp. NBC_00988]